MTTDRDQKELENQVCVLIAEKIVLREALTKVRQWIADLPIPTQGATWMLGVVDDAVRGSSSWQLIDSAPKDGTEIILGSFREDFEDPIVMNSCWIDDDERGCYWLDWRGLPEPTHWMFLPPLPKD